MSEPGTPLPWVQHQLFANQILSGGDRYDLGGECVAVASNGDEEQNAAYIVEACNNYPKLVEALRDCVEQMENEDMRYKPVKMAPLLGWCQAIGYANQLLEELDGEPR